MHSVNNKSTIGLNSFVRFDGSEKNHQILPTQVKKLRDLGVSAASLSTVESDEEAKALEEGKYSLVYATPESLLKTKCWKRMLSNKVYSKMACALAIDEVHVIKQWYAL